MDGSEARLIYCWTRCYNLEERFIVVKAALVLSREEVLRWFLDFNLGDGEEKGDFFGEALDLVARRSLQCFFVVGDIFWKSCVVDGDTLGGASMGFLVNNLGSLKLGVRGCGFSAEEALEKMESSWKVPCVRCYQMLAVEDVCWFVSTLQLNILRLL